MMQPADNGSWLEDYTPSFWGFRHIFRCDLLVSGVVYFYNNNNNNNNNNKRQLKNEKWHFSDRNFTKKHRFGENFGIDWFPSYHLWKWKFWKLLEYCFTFGPLIVGTQHQDQRNWNVVSTFNIRYSTAIKFSLIQNLTFKRLGNT